MADAGCNSCYMELAQEIPGIEEKDGYMCVNTEWGAFGKAGELDNIMTEFDILTDKQSANPGEHRLVILKWVVFGINYQVLACCMLL